MRASVRRGHQSGLTLVELMVSVALALLVTLAALLTSRQSGTAVEQTAALRDNARLGTELVRRIALQAGFESLASNSATREGAAKWDPAADPAADVEGFDNALVPPDGDPTAVAHGSRGSGCGGATDTSCVNGSDVLVVRFQGVSHGGKAGWSAINCAGQPVADAASHGDRSTSVFHVRRSPAGEPVLMCSYTDGAGNVLHRALIEGVEVFQVLYGVAAILNLRVTPIPEDEGRGHQA